MRIIQERQHHRDIIHLKTYTIKGTGCGYSFNCDENGIVLPENMNPEARVNWEHCQAGVNERGETITPTGLRKSISAWIEEAIGLCDNCGGNVGLGGFTNTCEKCGADYNNAGQRLADRSQWGVETGEHPADISRIP
jgi:hypothetical protein